MSLLRWFRRQCPQRSCNFAKLSKGGFKIFNDFSSQDVRLGQIGGIFKRFVA